MFIQVLIDFRSYHPQLCEPFVPTLCKEFSNCLMSVLPFGLISFKLSCTSVYSHHTHVLLC
ncbi:hypothetical protein CW304_01505 [Bacillus sp. UFRGS-B20]|nr:hypothetical protein CW304_01505 [Bacillus sp. UFRGS-B20]